MTMLKSVSLSIFLAGCAALYLAVLMLINPTLPGATSFVDARVAYSITVMLLALACCVVAGLTWSRASRTSAATAVTTALGLSVLFLIVVCLRLGLSANLPL